MHDIRWIRDNREAFDRGLARRGLAPLGDRLIGLDEERRAAIVKLEQAQARRNAASKEIGEAKKAKDEARAATLMGEVAELKTTIPQLEKTAKDTEESLNKALAEIPNLPLDDVPDGADEHSNIEHHHFGAKRNYEFAPKQHFELGEALGQMDFETAAKLSGARFVVLKKGLARLERALGQFFLDVHTQEHGYTEVQPPLLVRDEVMFGTAQLPKFGADQFFALSADLPAELRQGLSDSMKDLDKIGSMTSEVNSLTSSFFADIKSVLSRRGNSESIDGLLPAVDLIQNELLDLRSESVRLKKVEAIWAYATADLRWLIPTAEVPLTNLVRESILDQDQLPLRFTALTPCFRAEAGAAGKDTRGMIRQHQFDKVELVSVTTPEQSKGEHERMLSCAEEVLRRLDLHYRVMTLCTGDMGFASQKTYDIEVWLPGQGMYREISSCSICGEFQARRMQARYRDQDRQIRHVHTLNGSGVAVGRALIAVMETYQQADGSIAVPDVLQPYMGGMKTIGRAG